MCSEIAGLTLRIIACKQESYAHKVKCHWLHEMSQLSLFHFLPAELPVLNLLSVGLCVSGQKSAFSPLQEKLCVGSKKWSTPFRIVTTFSISMQSLGEIELRVPAVSIWAKIGVFLYVTLGLPARGDIVQTSIVWRFMGRFWCSFIALFSEWIVLSDALHSSHFCC